MLFVIVHRLLVCGICFFKQKTAYEMRISDWSSDVCSSDLISDWPAWQAVKADPVRATALLSMAFQMGAAGLAGFKNSLKLVEQKRWAEAAANMMLSKWAKQTPERAARVTKMIETGAYQA